MQNDLLKQVRNEAVKDFIDEVEEKVLEVNRYYKTQYRRYTGEEERVAILAHLDGRMEVLQELLSYYNSQQK